MLGKLYGEDKVIKALEKKSIKEWAYAIHDKAWSGQEFKAYCNKRGLRHRTLAIKPSAYQGVIKVAQRKPLKQS